MYSEYFGPSFKKGEKYFAFNGLSCGSDDFHEHLPFPGVDTAFRLYFVWWMLFVSGHSSI